MVSSPTTLHTLIRNVGVLWSDCDEKWFAPRDCLASQNFPVEEATRASGEFLCSFNRERPSGWPLRHRARVCGQAGNSMNVNVAGLLATYAHICVKKADTLCLTRMIRQTFKRSREELEGHGDHGAEPI